ncbi:hypothetical protein V6N11_021791 [Hibiscus sabdariffa]|uniref:Uncharacterized protein n=1 Tax=Hibiscus sabdariffa TaxID=183260 RepID=A0ABR2THA5_9ROSI
MIPYENMNTSDDVIAESCRNVNGNGMLLTSNSLSKKDWNSDLSKAGKGLSMDEKARKLALQHWLEAIDHRHRFGLMAIIFNFIMQNGFTMKLKNPSFTGFIKEKVKKSNLKIGIGQSFNNNASGTLVQ